MGEIGDGLFEKKKTAVKNDTPNGMSCTKVQPVDLNLLFSRSDFFQKFVCLPSFFLVLSRPFCKGTTTTSVGWWKLTDRKWTEKFKQRVIIDNGLLCVSGVA